MITIGHIDAENKKNSIDARRFERTWLDDALSSRDNKVPLTLSAMDGAQIKAYWANPSK